MCIYYFLIKENKNLIGSQYVNSVVKNLCNCRSSYLSRVLIMSESENKVEAAHRDLKEELQKELNCIDNTAGLLPHWCFSLLLYKSHSHRRTSKW